MSTTGKATRIDLTDFKSPQMRVFHLSWFAFFLSFFCLVRHRALDAGDPR